MTFPKTFDDGAFTIDKGVHGYQSFNRDGEKLIFSMTEWECEFWSRNYLKAQQEGWPDTEVSYSSTVGGKL